MLKAASSRHAASLAVAAALLLSFASTSMARNEDYYYPTDADHPLRIVHYFVAPVGNFLEYTVTRPLARLGSWIAPYRHIDSKSFSGCSRERPARSCTDVIK